VTTICKFSKQSGDLAYEHEWQLSNSLFHGSKFGSVPLADTGEIQEGHQYFIDASNIYVYALSPWVAMGGSV
jgi:hypothetical protein